MLRKVRIFFALVFLVSATLLLLGINSAVTAHLSWAARWQFLPAMLSLDVLVLVVLLAITALFGRIYCSTVCPLGVMQDIFGRLGGVVRRNRFSYSKEQRLLRYGVLAIFVLCLVVGFAPVTTLLAPYGAYGRIVNSLFKPAYDRLNNLVADYAYAHGSYAVDSVMLWTRGVAVPLVAVFTLLIVGGLAFFGGRTYCNTVCPVGTTLSLLSRHSLMRVQFDSDKCRQCSLCEKRCKASAIDYKNHSVDYSRCVVCGDCLDACHFGALNYKRIGIKAEPDNAAEHVDTGRRAFCAGVGVALGAAATAQTLGKVEGGMAVITEKKVPQRNEHITPPGSVSHSNMKRHCVACQLCVSACPNNVLRPSTDMQRFMQPEMSFERGYCRTECTECSQVCPAGAIKPISREQKTAVHIGHAVWIAGNCLVLTDHVSCGNCARHCPAQAITMVPHEGKPFQLVPAVDVTRCIGCGACENLCPARPFSAIYVEGHDQHIIS